MIHRWLCFAVIILLSGFAAQADDEDIYQKPEDFLREVFAGSPPGEQMLSIPKDLQPKINAIMEHSYSISTTRYWAKSGRSAWILEEIGKYKPITVGIVIENSAISQLKVLIYRESHGWQVKRDFFTDQFKGATLTDKQELSQTIDSISGATMSVDALRNLGKLALLLDQYAKQAR